MLQLRITLGYGEPPPANVVGKRGKNDLDGAAAEGGEEEAQVCLVATEDGSPPVAEMVVLALPLDEGARGRPS